MAEELATSILMPPLAILAGGLATRLRPITETIPKSLLPIAGQPFIAHQLHGLRKQGVTRVVLCVGHRGEQIVDFVGDGSRFGLSVAYSFDGPTQCGTGGALMKALPLLGEVFITMYGDSYLPTDFAPVMAHFHRAGRVELMTVFRNEGRWDSSNVVFENGEILVYDKIHKTGDMAFIDYGLGVFRAEAFGAFADRQAFDLAELYCALLSQGQLAGYEVRQRFYEIGSHAGLRETEELLRSKAEK